MNDSNAVLICLTKVNDFTSVELLPEVFISKISAKLVEYRRFVVGLNASPHPCSSIKVIVISITVLVELSMVATVAGKESLVTYTLFLPESTAIPHGLFATLTEASRTFPL